LLWLFQNISFKDKFHFSHKKNATLSSSILIFLRFNFN
jgi:hypothetical protein